MHRIKCHSTSSIIWRSSFLEHVDFFECTIRKETIDPHFHNQYVIYLLTKDNNLGFFKNARFIAQKGDVLIINPGEIHCEYLIDCMPVSYYCICLTPEYLKETISQLEMGDDLPVFTSTLIKDSSLSDKVVKLIGSATQSSGKIEIQTDYYDLIQYLLCHYRNQKNSQLSGYDDRVNVAIKYIKENYTENFSLSELSKHVCTSSFHLTRIFKSQVGQSPYDFLRNFRIEQAKKLLRNSKRSVADIAISVGFYDQSHFHICFKKQVGVTPREFQMGTMTSYK